MRPVQQPEFSVNSFDEWKAANASILKMLKFRPSTSSTDDFERGRKTTHSRTVSQIRNALSSISDEIQKIQRELTRIADLQVKYDDLHEYDQSCIMELRRAIVIQSTVRNQETHIYSTAFAFLQERERDLHNYMQLFSRDLVPKDLVCQIADSVFDLDWRPLTTKHQKRLAYLIPLWQRVEESVLKLPKAPWVKDFPGFFNRVLDEAEDRFLSDLSYCLPFNLEVTLSWCMFSGRSPHRLGIDRVIDQVVEEGITGQEFTKHVISECYRLIPGRQTMCPTRQSMALLVLFRCMFNRCYEKHPGFFAPKMPENLEKLCALPHFKARQFLLPEKMIGGEIGDATIGDLFRGNPFFRAASMFLENSVYETNPVDALYQVHKTLLGIHKGALINRKKDVEASVEDIKQLLCFDDLFALFFGCLMGTGPPTVDVFYVAWIIEHFAPKDSLSASFEYAQANLEALAMFCKRLDLEKLRSGNTVAPETGRY